MAVTDELRAAYSATAARWHAGPARIYDRMAEVLVDRSLVPVRGSRVADVGAGTGAVGRAARRAGAASVVALDPAIGMLVADPERSSAIAADARDLPVRSKGFDVAVAAFSLTHLDDPAAGVRELVRILRPGGAVVVGAYAADDAHPVKEAVEEALRERGWEPPGWASRVRAGPMTLLATVDGARTMARAAGIDAVVEHDRVHFDDLGPEALVGWRLGLAQHAPFLARLPPAERDDVAATAVRALGTRTPPLVRSVIALKATV